MVPMLHTILMVLCFWSFIYFINRVLSNYGPFKGIYTQCQEDLGLSMHFAHFRVYTTRFNKIFKLWGVCTRRLARLWFDIGVIVGLLLMVMSIVVMVFALYQNLIKGEQSKEKQILTPLMPGVNLPWNELTHYFLTIIICGVFHEIGHALAAVTEQVRINGFGIFLLFIYPGAFVDLHSDHLSVISPRRQLRIYCAGVWHNVILSVAMVMFIQVLPYLLLPFYASGEGAVITYIDKNSVLQGKLSLGDAIIQIDSCQTVDTNDWYSCIEDISSHTQTGYCLDKEYLRSLIVYAENKTTPLDDGTRECCPSDTQSDICFSFSDTPTTRINHNVKKYVCARAREVLTASVCHGNEECLIINPNSICITPTIAVTQHNHLAKLRHTGNGDPVIFLGDLRTLLYTTKVSDYMPVSNTFSPVWLPPFLRTISIYILSISSALAMLNMLPAYALDGQWALAAFMENILPEHPKRNKIVNLILTIGTVLLIMNIILGIWILINW